jgi:nucleoside-diphosphate-sugar epimerase
VSTDHPPWPEAVRDEAALEELLSRPSGADVAFARTLDDDVLVLGAGGKVGPSLARRVRRALDAAGASRRVLGVDRFSEPGSREALERDGVETLPCDLLDPAQVARLPRVGNVLFLAGRKFGSTDRPDLTWMQNVVVPSVVAPHFAESRIVVFSSGNVYPLVQPGGAGATERDPVAPVGEYAQTCVGRERVFEHASRERGTRCLLFRLFYAVDLRYGTLVDVARHVHAGEPVSLAAGHVNAIWQGDAASYAFRSLALCETPPRPLAVTGPGAISVRDAAKAFGRRFDKAVRFTGRPGAALLGDPSLCVSLLGPPEVPLARLLDWVAAWVERGGRSLGKPTHFEATDGRF